MKTGQDMERDKTDQAFAAHLALIVKDIQAWINLFAEDAVVEFPYASALGLTERFEGKPAIYNHMKDALFSDAKFDIHECSRISNIKP